MDVATAAIVFAVFYWTEIWDEHTQEHGSEKPALRLLIPVGLLAGYAYAAKYTAFPDRDLRAGIRGVAQRRLRPIKERLRPLLVVAGCALLMAGPWIARNWIWYQNPLAPFANWVFRNPYIHVIFEQEYSESLRNYGMPSLRPLPLAHEATIHGQYIGGIIGPAFLLLPASAGGAAVSAGRRLLLAGALVFSTYFANIGARFLIPCLPFFSLALATGVRRSGSVAGGADAVPRGGFLASGPEPVRESGLLEAGAVSLPGGAAHHAAGPIPAGERALDTAVARMIEARCRRASRCSPWTAFRIPTPPAKFW